MKIYLKNQKDGSRFMIAKVADTVGFEEFLKASFDILQVNENQYLLILKELGNPETVRKFFIGCFPSPEEISSHINEMFSIEKDEDNNDSEDHLVEFKPTEQR